MRKWKVLNLMDYSQNRFGIFFPRSVGVEDTVDDVEEKEERF